MADAKYLLYLNTSPKGISDQTWAKWFVNQHLATLEVSKVCTRVSIYRETDFPMLPNPEHPLRFLALYETEKEGLQNDSAYKPASPEEESDMRNYKMIQDYNPKNLGDGNAPTLFQSIEERTDRRYM